MLFKQVFKRISKPLSEGNKIYMISYYITIVHSHDQGRKIVTHCSSELINKINVYTSHYAINSANSSY